MELLRDFTQKLSCAFPFKTIWCVSFIHKMPTIILHRCKVLIDA